MNLKFRCIMPFGFLAEAFDGREDFVCGFGPFKGSWVLVVLFDEGMDIGFQFGG